MSVSGRTGAFLVQFASSLSALRRVPVLGNILRWTSRRLVPPGALVWVKIQAGAGAGLWIRVNPRTGKVVQQGLGEQAVQRALQQHVQPGMTFYDVGANIGFFSLIAARLVGPSGRVFSFEPDPENVARLKDNFAHNNFDWTAAEEKAVWSEATTVSFERVDSSTSPDRGLGHVAREPSKSDNMISVQAISLDDYTSSRAEPDFLKCDVEGAEVAVFEGAANLLRRKRAILLVEMHSPENQQLLTEKFRRLGYTVTNLDENHVLCLP